MTKAEEMFDLEYKVAFYENTLCELLSSFGDGFTWEDEHHDAYDNSIEIYGLPEAYVLTDEQKQKLREFGFGQVWTHTTPDRQKFDDRENWYSLIDFSTYRIKNVVAG